MTLPESINTRIPNHSLVKQHTAYITKASIHYNYPTHF
jgi:hypothetical protein